MKHVREQVADEYAQLGRAQRNDSLEILLFANDENLSANQPGKAWRR
jgi:hypothetical protein